MASSCDIITSKGRRTFSSHAHSMHTYLWHFVISCLVVTCLIRPSWSSQDWSDTDTGTRLYAQDLDLKLYEGSAYKPSYYRYLTIDVESNYLFVGAMNRLYGFFLNNIAHESKRFIKHFPPPQGNLEKCKISGKEENFECQNHIRFLVRNKTVPNTFYMCSTGSYTAPKAYQLEFKNNDFITRNENMMGQGICPYDPADNFTAILVDKGTPGGIPSLFAGTYTDSIKSDPIFWRQATYRTDGSLVASRLRNYRLSPWLNEPQFVGSFEDDDAVFVFFREVALEYTNCGKKIYSRVAKVCKDDRDRNFLKETWTSFVKARLNCSIPGEYPYYFDEIQDVIRVGDSFYALFTTNINGLTASAICVYDLKYLKERAFSGQFKEQRDEKSMWLPMKESEIPKPRPGNCSTIRRTNNRDESPLMKLLSTTTMLMDKAVSHKFGRPIFYKSNTLIQKLVGTENVAGLNEIVFFAATNTGLIYKIAAWPGLTSLDAPKTYQVSTYVPFQNNRPIWSLQMHKNWIYFGTDMAVGQIEVETCDQYKKIDLCIYDPYCGWDKHLRECHSNNRPNLINHKKIDLLSYSLEEAITKQVGQLYSFEKISKFTGSSVTLAVDYLLHIPGTVHWSRNGTQLTSKRHILAKDNSYIITDLRREDKGFYKAMDEQGRTVSEYYLDVQTNKEQIEQRWMQKFDEWCDEFERYQEDIRQWERKCESCCQDTALTNAVKAIGDGQ